MADQESELDKIRGQLNSMELRLRRLESAFVYSGAKIPSIAEEKTRKPEQETVTEDLNGEEKGLESQIGRFGLAWMGNIVLLFGITFLSQYLINLGSQVVAIILGYIAAASIYAISEYLKKSNTHLSFMFRINAQVLIFYVTLRLHFFSVEPLLSNKALPVFLLLIIAALQAYLSIREKSQSFAALAVLFILTTAVISDSTPFTIPLLIIAAAGAMLYFLRFNWKTLFVVTIFLTYAGFLLWIVGDPVMGHPAKLVSEKYLGVFCLFSLGGNLLDRIDIQR